MSPLQTYGGSTNTSTTTTQASSPSTFPGATSSAGSSLEAQLTAIAKQLSGVTPAQFAADYDIDSTELAGYQATNSAGDLTNALNANAVYLAYYLSMSQSERQSIQNQMVAAGDLSDSDADGINNSTALSAFQKLIGQTSATGSNVFTYLDQNGSGTNAIQNQISAGLTTAQKNAAQPIVATVENPTTLSADITAAFETALGYSPDSTQINSFISQVQGQDTTYAEAPRAEAQAQITQAQDEESALNKLGPNGIDTVIQAYQAAVSGTKMPGAGTVQGPVNGAAPGPQTPIGSPLQPGTVPTMNQQGTVVGGQVQNTTQTKNVTQNPSLLDQALHGFLNPQSPTVKQVTTHGTKVTPLPAPATGTPNTIPTYGGLYALSAKDWKEVQAEYPAAKKYATPGSAPQSVQLGAITTLLSSAYDSNGGSWSKAITSIASGSPFGTAEGTHLASFGTSIANEVNSQIEAVQNQVNNDTVTTKVSAPDAVAEADLAAKQSDPTGYYAAQDASWGSVLNKMLSGTPDMYDQSSSDTFTGPVASEAETGATAPTTVGAGGV